MTGAITFAYHRGGLAAAEAGVARAGQVGSEGEARGGLGVDFEGEVDKWGRDLLGKGSVAVGEELDTHLGLDYMKGLLKINNRQIIFKKGDC